MTEEITASMTYDAKSMLPALRWHNHGQNRLTMTVGLIALVMGTLSFLAARFSPPSSDGFVIRPIFAAVPAITVVFVLFLRWVGPFLFARSIKSSPAHGKPITFRINDEGVKVTIANGKTDYGWSHFLRGLITPGGVLLYTQKLAFNWLPKTAFATESDYARFLGLVTVKTQHSKIG